MFYKASIAEFITARDRTGEQLKPFISNLKPNELGDAELYLNGDATAGFGIMHGELINLFNIGESGNGSRAVEYAIGLGVNRLNCFDGFLTGYYKAHGFKVTERIAWDDRYAPADWDYQRFGRPDVIEMAI